MAAVEVEEEGEDGEKEPGVKREKPVVRPEEIPRVPENRFLLRRDVPAQDDPPNATEQEAPTPLTDAKPAVTKSGRKMKGRGTMRYHTPPGSKSPSASEEERGNSETPPHWKEEMERTKSYQPAPPDAEKWSKGEKLNERSSSRWDNRSDSQSDDLSSDHSSRRSSPDRRLKKEKKKAKRKKKAKKRKHAKKHKTARSKLQEPAHSEGEGSLSSGRRSKVPSHLDRRSASPSRSPSAHLSSRRKPSSALDKRHQSSLSSRDSRSYSSSRSRSRSRGRFRSSSGSRSRSWSSSRSRSPSRYASRSRSRSRYRSRSMSRSRRRRSSRSPRKAKMADIKPKAKAHVQLLSSKSEDTKQPTPGPAAPAPESTPVIPMSDSPPPSRWKPDQKPWKPSYVRIQEIKAKTTPISLTPAGPAASDASGNEIAPSIAQKSHPENSHSGKSHGNKRHGHERRSHSGSSRSRSYSRSSSRSRGRSRSRSQSPGRYNSRSSSYSRSDSYDSPRRSSSRRRSVDEGWKQYYSTLKRITNIILPNATKPLSKSKDGSGSERSHQNSSKGHIRETSEPLTEKGSLQAGARDSKTTTPLPLVDDHNSKSDWDSDGDKLGKKKSPEVLSHRLAGESGDNIPEKKLLVIAGWDSESDSEKTSTKMVASEKEEGEASSESERDDSVPYHKMNKATVKSDTQVPSTPADAPSPLETTDVVAQAEKRKSRKKSKRKHKHKRRNATKSGSHRSKEKGKRSKRKHQKLKETFHWQPPLEFGDEEEEEDSQKEKHADQKRITVKDGSPNHVKRKPSKSPTIVQVPKGQNLTSSNNNSATAETLGMKYHGEMTKEQRAKQSFQANSKQSELKDLSANKMDPKNSVVPDEPESLDDMEICTPEHGVLETLPEPDVPQSLPNKAHEITLSNPLHKVTKDDELLQPLLKQQQSTNAGTTTIMLAREQHPEILSTKTLGGAGDLKWKPLKGGVQSWNLSPVTAKTTGHQDSAAAAAAGQGVRMEIKSKSRVRPGSLFDEVRKTARLNQRPRNQDDSSSEERSGSETENRRGGSRSRSPRKSRSGSSRRSHSRGRPHSSSRSRSRSHSSSYSSRSRSRSHRRNNRRRSRSQSSTYRSYRSHSRTYNRSHSRSRSYGRRRRSRSDTDRSSSSRSRSGGRRHGGRRRSESYRSSRSRSSSRRSSSRHRSPTSHSSRYS